MQVSDWAEGATAIGNIGAGRRHVFFGPIRKSSGPQRGARTERGPSTRAVLFATHETTQKIRWGDDHWAMLETGHAVLEEKDGVIYMAISLQNVGAGIAELSGLAGRHHANDRSALLL
jgi:hypothetical protein